ncbi:MAG: hypothetical protein IKN87_00140 [Bacilli bacterium]|nr:hypothetical protein [Bacilli bacterium]
MDLGFSSEKELYDRLIPALKTKENEFKRNGITYVHMEDIWNYLKITRWSKCRDLLLYQMVDDILNIELYKIDDYVKILLSKKHQKPIID